MWADTKTEGFEAATTTTTYNSTQTITTAKSDCGIAWSIYYGSPSTTSAITGSKSCLIRYYTADAKLGYAKTTTGIQGLSNVTFNAKVTNTGNKMGVWYSTDGENWTAIATDVTLTTSSASKSYDIPNSSSSTAYYVKIGLTTGSSTNKKDLIIDDVVFTYSTGPTTYSVTYDDNGATSGSVPEDNNEYEENNEVTILDNTGSLTKVGHAFGGWNTQANGEGTNYSAGDTFEITANTTLYAKWNPYTITAQSNNSNYGTVSLTGKVITGSPNSGYRYASPAYTVDPENSATVTQEGDAFTVTPSANTTVTINFEAIPTHTATFSVNDVPAFQDFAEGATITFPNNPADVNGKKFVGWVAEAIDGTTDDEPEFVTSATMSTSDVTYYAVFASVTPGSQTEVTDVLTTSTFGSPSSYGDWSGKSATDGSSAVYAGNSTTNGSSAIQIRSDNSNSGIVSTTSGGKLSKVVLVWNQSTTNGRVLNVYGSNTAYSKATDLYNNTKQGTLLCSSTKTNEAIGSEVELTIEGDYEYIGFRSNSGAMYINSISVTWVTVSPDTYSEYCTTVVAPAVEKPVITVAENPFLFSTTATITCETEGATIKYSYDGETWNDYSSALTITETKTIYAKAVKDENESSVAQVTATKNLATPTVTVSGDLTLDLDGETDVEAGTLTAAVIYNEEAVEGAVVAWSSNNADVATIDAETGAVTIKTTGTVTFTATYAGNSDYAEATGSKTVTVTDSKVPGSVGNPYTVAQAITAIQALPNNNATSEKYYVSGIVSAFYGDATGIMSASSKRYYISDDGTTENHLLVYNGKGLNNEAFSSDEDLLVGDRVTIYGAIQNYQGNTPEIASGNYLTSRTELPASDLTKTGDITLDYKNGATGADLTEYFTTSSTGAITYTVADETVIENAEELISALKVGTTTVTVSQAATLSYKAGEIVINVTVQDTREAATTIPAINISTLKVGDADGTISVVNPGKADEGVTFSFVSSDENVLLVNGTTYTVGEAGTTTVTVTATPSNANLYTSVVANFPVTVELATKTDTEISLATSGSTIYGTAKSVDFTITDGYDGEMDYTIDNAAIADVEIGASAITFTPKAVGTAVITISAPATATFNAADVEYTLTVTAPVGGENAPATESPVTLDFSDNTSWGFPTSKTVDENTYTDGDYSVVLTGTTGNGYYFFSQYNCLLIGKSGATIQLPSFDKVVEQIDVTGHSNASSTVKLNVFEGETAISTEVTGITSTQSFEVAEANQGANKTYTLKVTSAANAQIKNITFNFKNTTISAKLNGSGYATFCSHYPLDFTTTEGYTAWQITDIDGENITFSKIEGPIKGGQGILLKGTAGETVTLTSVDSDNEMSENLLFGTTAPTYITADTYYGLSGNKFVRVNAGTVPAGKALLPASVIPASARELTFIFEGDETTKITTTDFTDNGAWYSIDGRKLDKKPSSKGLYIKNGKVVVIK